MELQILTNKERFVFPGETIIIQNAKASKHSFYEQDSKLKPFYFGLFLQQDIGGKPFLDIAKRVTTYLPEKNQFVIGVVKSKGGDSFTVDINAPMDGVLGGLEFDGATKRNKPNLLAGDIVYTRIADYSKFIGAKLSCLNAGYSAKSVLGELKGGVCVYGLRGKEQILEGKLQILSKYCQFEVALGKNDILWFSCPNPNTQMILFNIFNEIFKGCSEELFQNLLKLLSK